MSGANSSRPSAGSPEPSGALIAAQFANADLDALPPGLVLPGTNPVVVMGQPEPMLRRAGSPMFSMQVGQGLAALAGETLTGTEVSLPLTPDGPLVLVPSNIAAFAEGWIDPTRSGSIPRFGRPVRLRFLSTAPRGWGPQLLTAVQDMPAASNSTRRNRVGDDRHRPDRS